MITDSSNISKTIICLKSVLNQGIDNFEINLIGDIKPLSKYCSNNKNINLINKKQMAKNAEVSRMRNEAASRSDGDIIIWMDDDILLGSNWFQNFQNYEDSWEVLSNKILLPNGDRFWDRATIRPHKLVHYDFEPTDKNLYQTSGFLMMKRKVFDEYQWSEKHNFHADEAGEIPEDVEYSQRLLDNNIALEFDKNNVVWHWDEKYVRYNDQTLLRELLPYRKLSLDRKFINNLDNLGAKIIKKEY